MAEAPKYCANYCEENIWHLAGESGLAEGSRHVVMFTSRTRSVPVWCQKAAPGEDDPVFWDYHVILVVKSPSGGVVYDYDTRLPFPSSFESYVARTFGPGRRMPFNYQPRFRVLTADEYRRGFASDRSHMKRPDGSYRSPAPPWPAIMASPASLPLKTALDMKRPLPGEVVDLDGLIAKLGP